MIKKIILSLITTIIIITITIYSYTKFFYSKQLLIKNINLSAQNLAIPAQISDISFNILSGISLYNVSFEKNLSDSNVYFKFNFPEIKVNYDYLSLLLHRKLICKDIVIINPLINIETKQTKSKINFAEIKQDKITKLVFSFLSTTVSNIQKNKISIKKGNIYYGKQNLLSNISGSIYNSKSIIFSLYAFLNKEKIELSGKIDLNTQFSPATLIFKGSKLDGKFSCLFKNEFLNFQTIFINYNNSRLFSRGYLNLKNFNIDLSNQLSLNISDFPNIFSSMPIYDMLETKYIDIDCALSGNILDSSSLILKGILKNNLINGDFSAGLKNKQLYLIYFNSIFTLSGTKFSILPTIKDTLKKYENLDIENQKAHIKIQSMTQYIYNNNFFSIFENQNNLKLITDNNIYNFINNAGKIELINVEAIEII